MSYDLKGTIKVINETQVISDSFSKREFVVVDSSEKYEQTIQFQAAQDNCAKLDNFKVGDDVQVSFNLKGREWTNPKDGVVRYFNSLDAWKIEALEAGQSTEQPTADQMGDDSDISGLPF
tara:strand:+ start:244 stop:603 length:360 start_codon:yes stop_codon:yes gene_type:complete